FLTTLAIVLGVMVLFGANTVLPSMLSALQGSMLGASGTADLTISSATGEAFTSDTLATVQGTAGVAAAAPSLRRDFTLPNAASAITLTGLDPVSALNFRPYGMDQGRFLQASDTDAAVTTAGIAQSLGVQVGGTLHLPTPQGLHDFTLVGILAPNGSDQIL